MRISRNIFNLYVYIQQIDETTNLKSVTPCKRPSKNRNKVSYYLQNVTILI